MSCTAPSWRVGDVCITRIQEVSHRLPIQQFIPLADAERRRQHARWLSPAQLDAAGMMTLPICAFVVESRGRRILVDTCIGPEHERGSPESPFLARLTEAGFALDRIDAVVCTHVHFDHIGWNTVLVDGKRRPTFVRADYFFCEDEWAALCDADHSGLLFSSVEHDFAWVLGSGHGSLVPAAHRLTDEVSLLPTFGHSPGHVAILVSSGGRQAIITGDSVHHPIQLLAPELATVADFDPGQAVRSRLSLIDRALDTGALVLGTHFADPSAAVLEDHSPGIALRPIKPEQFSVGSHGTAT
jgi:glyoxylase-like metal-dependent hydrolase (beta-lactamase superfamily II)